MLMNTPSINKFTGNFDATEYLPHKNFQSTADKIIRTTFNVDDWIAHTPKSILAKNFGVNESFFDTVPTPDPYILKANASHENVTSPYGKLEGNSSYVYHLSKKSMPRAPGGGGTVAIVDSRNFPIATTIAAAVVTLEPRGLRELHWHPNVCFPSSSLI